MVQCKQTRLILKILKAFTYFEYNAYSFGLKAVK